MKNKPKLTINILKKEAALFCKKKINAEIFELYGVTDGKAIGTYIEHKFRTHLITQYSFFPGNSSRGIDFPDIGVDIKVTSIKQPQSSCPFKSARQKIYGLGYSLLVFVYEKVDDQKSKSAMLNFLNTILIEEKQTADFQTTTGLLQILDNNGNTDDLIAFIIDRNLPVEEIEAAKLAEEILKRRPEQGYLTISNALQWRLQYGRVIQEAGKVDGILNLMQ